jgi:lipopolysaccharide export system permease protein
LTKLIDRYFIKEFSPPFFFSVFALTFILLMDQLFRLIDLFVRKGLPVIIVGQILINTIPLILSYTVPMGLLVAVVMSFGRLAQDNEILALKTSGMTFARITRTPLIVAFCFIVPDANHRVRNLMLDVSRKRPAVRLPEGVFTKDFTGYTVYVGRKDERTSQLYDITVYDLGEGLMMTAPRGELKDFEEEGILQFVLYDGELHQLTENKHYQRTKFDKQTINMKIDTELVRRERKQRQQNELSVIGLTQVVDSTHHDITEIKHEISEIGVNAVNQYVNGETETLDAARFEIEKRLKRIEGKNRKASRYLVELHKKFSLAFACILFIVIGAPLGYLFKKGGIGGVIVGILLFSSYYILVLTGEEFADRRGFSPFWALWLPNVILLLCGLYLFYVAYYEKHPFRRILK